MPRYHGHRSWNAWNVALWIGNDESLYRLALLMIREHRTKDEAARAMLADLQFMGTTETPDGAPYTFTSIREALRGL